MELNRLMLYIDLKVIVSDPQFDYQVKSNHEVETAFIEAEKYIKNIKKFCPNSDSVVSRNLGILSKQVVGSNSELTQGERQMISKAMTTYCFEAVGIGSFYACPNGHVYVIGNCGGAVTQSLSLIHI